MNDLWSAQGLASLTIGLNILLYSHDEAAASCYENAFAVAQNNSIKAMMVSMFTHANLQHLLSNMASLFFTSLSVFIDPPQRWNSPFAFLSIYIPSGLAGFMGNSLVFSIMQGAYSKKRENQTLSEWVHGMWNGTVFLERSVLSRQAMTKRVGASAAVYGLVGARIYTAIWSPHHAPFNSDDLNTLLCLIGQVTKSREAWSIDSVLTTENLVDYTAHLFGFVTGMTTAWIWDKWSRYCWSRRTIVKRRLKPKSSSK